MPRLPRRRPAARPALLAVAAAALVLGGCTGADDGPGEGSAEGSPSASGSERPLAAYDTEGLVLSRTNPCPELPEDAVTAALGGEVSDGTAYEPGERARLAPGVRDVTQEAGCVFESEEGATVRAWVFAPPVPPGRARGFAKQLRNEQGCRPLADAPAFGEPGVGRTCQRGSSTVGSYGGLFGDAWLGCSLAVPAAEAKGDEGSAALVERTGAWCVAVLDAARAVAESGS